MWRHLLAPCPARRPLAAYTGWATPSLAATGSMLNSIRNWSRSVGRRRVIRSTTAARALSGLRPVGAVDGLDEGLHVLPLPSRCAGVTGPPCPMWSVASAGQLVA